MYIHAYQSLIWNEIVSQRIANFGLELREGDLVYADKIEVAEVIEAAVLDESEEDNEGDETGTETSDSETSEVRFAKVKALTKADIESNVYTIFDVVLPLPGFDVEYPANECAEWYVNRLAEDNVTSEKFKQKNK